MTGRTSGRRPSRKRAAAASAAMAEPEAAPAYMFNPGPEFSDRMRMDGAALVNSGRFAVVDGSGGNAVLFGAPANDSGERCLDSDPDACRATACPAKCQCLEFQQRAACRHVLAAMIVRAGSGFPIACGAGRRKGRCGA